jgi:glycosyltransferase involved in cell wall biosynthesis
MSRRLLAIAYHYPPIQGSSGVHRTLAFSRFLGRHDWRVSVLTVNPRAYEQVRQENLALVPPEVTVLPAPAWDTVRHLSVRGRYLRAMALPDRWQSWIPGGVSTGLKAIRRDGVTALFSTFPIASAHCIGLLLKRRTGLPWVADFRDPMYQENYPPDPWVRRTWRWIEGQVFRHADRITVTTPGTARYYARRYGLLAKKVRVIPNGYDPGAFPAALPGTTEAVHPDPGRKLVLVHSGILYPYERDPEPFFRALAGLVRQEPAVTGSLEVRFRGSVHGERYQGLVEELGLAGVVSFLPALPYREAISEMLAADGLLVFQAANCNNQIPAKVYEYLYAGRPVIGITDPEGDTGRLLAEMGITHLAALEDQAAIAALLREALPAIRAGTAPLPRRDQVAGLSREAGTAALAGVLDEIAPEARRPS